MKKFILLLYLLVSVISSSNSQSVSWNSPITIASGTTYSNAYPRLNLITGDVPLITWNHSSSASIYSSYLMGTSFSTPLKVNPAGTTPMLYSWAGVETTSSGDTVIAVFSASVAGVSNIYTVRSIDGGITFEDTVRASSFIGNDMAMFPSIGMGLNGNPIVSFMRMDSAMGNPEWVTSRSVDGGSTYLPDVCVSNLDPDNVCDCCPSTIVTSGTKHVTLFRNNESNIRTIYAAFSTDESATYPIQTQVDLTNWMIMACPSTGPSGVIVGDSLIYTWRSQNTSKIYIATVNINDQQIGVHRLLSPFSVGTENYPVIAAKGDTIGVVWQENYSGATDVYFTFSTTGVAGLGINIDTLTTTMTSTQSRPDLAFNNKKFHVSFSDVIGSDIVYMQGYITNVGINENFTTENIQLLSAYENNGVLELKIKSTINTNAQIQATNMLGQQNFNESLHISPGINSYSISKNISNGIHFISLISNDGKKQGLKLFISK